MKFSSLDEIAENFRKILEIKKYILLFAYNGVGKTRLSMAFKNKKDNERDTLYFNAFTEDLFIWDNDLENDSRRMLRLNPRSRFFDGLQELAIENHIRPLLHRYANFDFSIYYGEEPTIIFTRTLPKSLPNTSENSLENSEDGIKISRGEENTFVWCFFLAIARLAIDKEEGSAYEWVKYIYIDDPISSLDDNNAIAVAHYLAELFKQSDSDVKAIVSSHHTLFFNVMCNEWGKADKYFLSKSDTDGSYTLRQMHGDTARFYHVAVLRPNKSIFFSA